MIEIILTVVIIALLAYIAWSDFLNRREREKTTNALLSRNAQEFRDLELTDKVKPITPITPEPDLIPESELSDTDFYERVEKET